MKTIFQNCEVAFHAVQLQDAIVVSKLMDALRYSYVSSLYENLYWGISKEEREQYERYYPQLKGNNIQLSANDLENIFTVLTECGFCCSDGGTTLPDVELVKKEG